MPLSESGALTLEQRHPRHGQGDASRTQQDPETRHVQLAASQRWRTAPCALALLLLVLGDALRSPTLVLLGLGFAVAAMLLRWMSWHLAIPASALCLLLLAIALGSLAAALKVNLLADPTELCITQLLLIGVTGLVVARSAGAAPPAPPSVPRLHAWVAAPPAIIAALIGLAQAVDDRLSATWSLLGTDIAEHVVLLGGIQSSGNLSYSASSGYPRAVHMLLALAAPLRTPPAGSAGLLARDLQLYSGAIWLGLAVLLWTSAITASMLATRLGMRQATGTAASAVVGWALLGCQSLQLSFVHMGALPALLAIIALWSLPLALLARPAVGPIPQLVALGLSALLIAHLWQALLLAPAAGFLALAFRRDTLLAVRQLTSAQLLRTAGAAVLVVALTVPFALAALAPVHAIAAAGGLALAAVPGHIPAAPWAAVAAALLLLPLTCYATFGALRRIVVSTASALLATTLLLAWGDGAGVHLDRYYPMKALWLFVLYLTPGIALVACHASAVVAAGSRRLASRLPRIRLVIRGGVLAANAVVCASIILPGLVGPHSLPRQALDDNPMRGPGPRRLAIAVGEARPYPGAVSVPVAVGLSFGTPETGPYVISKLLRFQTGQPDSYGDPEHICTDVQRVAGDQPAVVLTDLPEASLRPYANRGGCGDIEIRHVSGAPRRLLDPYTREIDLRNRVP